MADAPDDDLLPPKDRIRASFMARNDCFDPTRNSTLQQYLRDEWELAVQGLLGASQGLKIADEVNDTLDRWFQRLWEMHTEQSRYYHTAVHLFEMLKYLHLYNQCVQKSEGNGENLTVDDETTIRLAIYFHDAIYDPRSATNERDSAHLFQEFTKEPTLSRISTDSATTFSNVIDFIEATQKHLVSKNNSKALSVFLDLDMAVLGKTHDAYMSYSRLIRREYSFVPHDTYCKKRADILEGFLKQPSSIYGTELMREAMEEQARTNIRHEIDSLRSRRIPGEPLENT